MANYENAIQQLYVAYYNRPADPAGLAFWQGVVEGAGGDTSAVSAAFASSAEYIANYGGKTNRAVVETVYLNLFSRPGEDDGVDYWADALDKGLITVDAAVTAIAAGARNADLVAYNNKVKYASSFTTALDVHPEKAAYNGNEALAFAKQLTSAVTTDASLATATGNLEASTAAFVAASKAPILFTLSANADTGVAFKGGGGDDTYHATAATFSAGDSLHGGGGRNSLIVMDEGSALAAAAPTGATLTNIQELSISTKGGVGNANAYDLSGFVDLRTVGIVAGGAINAKVADTVELNVRTGAGAVTTQGGHAVWVSGNTAAATLSGNALTTVGLANTTQGATINNGTADHTLALYLNGVGNGATVTDAAAKTVNLKVAGGPADEGSNINLAAAKATTVNIDNSTNFQLTTTALAADDKLASMSLKGAGSFSADLSGIATLSSFDGAQSSGANTLAFTSIAGLNVKGGSGVDKVSMKGALANNAVVELGAGADRYEFDRAALSGAKVDAGAGIDTIVANDAALFGAGNPVYSNFEILDFSSGKGVYDLDRVGSVTTLHTHARLRDVVEFTNGRANSTIEMVSLDNNLDLSGQPAEQFVIGANIKFSLKDASGANDKLTISMTSNDARAEGRTNGQVQANTVEANGIETIDIHSTVNKMEPDNPATTGTNEARVASDYVNSFSSLRLEGAKTVHVTGNATLDINTIYSDTLTTFDASAATGNVWFDGLTRSAAGTATALNYIGSQGSDQYTATKAGVVFQGNTGKDDVLLYRYEQVKDVIKFAKASDSQLIWASGNNKQVNGFDVIYDFQSGVDKIDLSGLHLAAGANLQGFAKFNVASNTDHILQSTLKDGVGVFNDNGVNRSLAFAMYGVDDGWMLVDVNGDGNYSSDVDMVFAMYGNTAIPVMSDFIF